MKPFLSVIIPAYNEAKRLPLTLIDVDRILSAADYSSEVIIVDDGSTDNTRRIVHEFSRVMSNLRLIENEGRHGKGWVVRQGMLTAKGNWRLFMDADNSTSLSHFSPMIPFLKDGYGVFICSRRLKGSSMKPPQSFLKRTLGRVGNLIIQAMVLKGLWDTQCGFKCFSEEATERIFRRSRTDGLGFDVEALVVARMLGYNIKEIPVQWINNPHSKVRAVDYFKTLFEVSRIYWRRRRGAYGADAKAA